MINWPVGCSCDQLRKTMRHVSLTVKSVVWVVNERQLNKNMGDTSGQKNFDWLKSDKFSSLKSEW